MLPVPLAWIIFGGVILGVLFFCWVIVRYYQDKHEAEWFPTLVSVLGLALTLLCVFLIPLDIYSVSSTSDPNTGERLIDEATIEQRSRAIKVIYYILYSSVLAFAFGIIPFAYFYYEEADENVTTRERVWGGCKYTIFLLIIVVILLVIGLVVFLVKPGDRPTNTTEAAQWVQNFLKQSNLVETSISFAIAGLTVIGYLIWITYTAYGLSAFPIGIFRGKRNYAEEVSDLQSNLDSTRDKARTIKSKYAGKKLSRKDEDQLNLLARQERVLARRGQRLEASSSGWRKLWMACKPFMFIFGIVFILVSLLIITSITLTNVDKVTHGGSLCGSKCGFLLAYPQLANPLDIVLTATSKYFPIDYVIIGSLILYIFFCTLSGIIKIGIRFLWVHMYNIRRGSTAPQGLLVAAIILMFSMLSLNMEITTLAPQYANWGSQVWKNGTEVHKCSLNAPQGACTITQIGFFVSTISVRTSFFGVIFYYATWLFIAFFVIGSVIAVIKSKPSNVEQRDSDSDEDEN